MENSTDRPRIQGSLFLQMQPVQSNDKSSSTTTTKRSQVKCFLTYAIQK